MRSAMSAPLHSQLQRYGFIGGTMDRKTTVLHGWFREQLAYGFFVVKVVVPRLWNEQILSVLNSRNILKQHSEIKDQMNLF